jgi:hypothetical protein
MDLTKFNFPENDLTNKDLLAEAKERGFYNGHTPYNKLFSTLFYSGGKVKFKENVDKDFIKKAWGYCRFFMGSWSPKHEEKEAICALLMSETLEPNLDLS